MNVREAPRKPSERKSGFLFLGNQKALDFVNTRPVKDGKSVELLDDFAAVLQWFQEADLLRSEGVRRLKRKWQGTDRAQRTTERMVALREKLRKDILIWEQRGVIRASTVEELNALMLQHPMRAKLALNGKALSTELWFELREPDDLFAPLAHSAVKLFTETDHGRVRKCGSCALHFLDTSKKGTRHWCSMRLCGNRLKVAAYAARRRQNHTL